jgi:hypothetical protein
MATKKQLPEIRIGRRKSTVSRREVARVWKQLIAERDEDLTRMARGLPPRNRPDPARK